MSSEYWIDVVGWLGAALLLFAYLMVSIRIWDGDSPRYQGFNLMGGISLIINTIYYGAYPSSFVNLVWVGIAIYTLARRNSKRGLSNS
jgi:hypothetical protein